jgi:hypothetical protein
VTLKKNRKVIVIIFPKVVGSDIDFDYYIQECYKIIDTVSGEKERQYQEKKAARLELKRLREEQHYLEFCINKIPTEKQWESYKKDYLIEKFGMPAKIKPSKQKVNPDQMVMDL